MATTGSFSPWHRHAPEFLHEFLLGASEAVPTRPAVVESAPDGGFHTVTYRELAAHTAARTEELAGLGIGVGDRVALESDSSAAVLTLLMACSALGATFLPLSPQSPVGRRLTIVGMTGPALYLRAGGEEPPGLPASTGTGRFGPEGLVIERAPARRAHHRTGAVSTDPAYVVFTSGSTGTPKGVVMSHRGYLAFCRGMLRHDIVTAEDRVASTSPFQFDFSLLDAGLALGSGATLVPVPRGLLRWPRRFARFLREAGATQVNGVPSIWRPLLRHEPARLSELGAVRGILFSGERFPLEDLRLLRGGLPGVRIVNCFGSTESIACTFSDIPDPLPADQADLSIGRPHAGAEILLIDDEGRPVDEPGAVGEIHLRSPALFTGYWNDPAATRAVLVADPLEPRSGQLVYRSGDLASRGADGELYFHGRVDSMVKIRGNRVELGAVEHRLRAFPSVEAATVLVVPRAGDTADPVLTAFVVPEPAADWDPVQLREFCGKELPDYMVPDELRAVDRLPLNPNGKVDRARLLALVLPGKERTG
ncbi:AMP-binding protein [Streptomyces sp. CBMA29]|uniref:AMP-binding protein n=1 Tax=Streptomyces sp. CBMA29 TaxID=1896314 RepID=UPI001661CC50|nr:AMP-binding protein [Streptomyces sp. CBMA29]MBD0735166.1 AMP-dependent synthetase [Streptomyces sp. CBMA29]